MDEDIHRTYPSEEERDEEESVRRRKEKEGESRRRRWLPLRLNSRIEVFCFLPSPPGSVVRHELEDFVDLMRSLGCFEVVVV